MGIFNIFEAPVYNLPVPIIKKEVESVRPKPCSVTNKITKKDFEDYINLAKRLNFSPAALLIKRIEVILLEASIPLYSQVDVYRYLHKLADSQKQIWYWSPLRSNDLHKVPKYKDSVVRYGEHYGCFGQFGSKLNNTYQKAVPMHILEQVKFLEEEINDEQIGFYVSDYQVPDPDPFICFSSPTIPIFIFGVWNEPKFFEFT